MEDRCKRKALQAFDPSVSVPTDAGAGVLDLLLSSIRLIG